MIELRNGKASNSVCGLRSVHFGVVDLEQALDFFTRVWGLSRISVSDQAAYLRGTGPAHYVVALHKRTHTEILRADLNAADRTAVDAIHARLAAAGAKALTSPVELTEPGGGYGFAVREPGGLLLLIVAGDERHAKHADAVDLPHKLSHLVLSTPDKGRSRAFSSRGSASVSSIARVGSTSSTATRTIIASRSSLRRTKGCTTWRLKCRALTP